MLSKKRGELRINGTELSGSLWIDGGQLVGCEVPRSPSLVAAGFELLRLRDGAFAFEADSEPRVAMPPQPITDVLDNAEQRLLEWRDIESVVPSLNVTVTLALEPPAPEVTLDAWQWRVLV